MEKKDLRRNLKNILSSISEEKKNKISEGISENFLELLSELNSQKIIVKGDIIGVFSPLPDEFEWFKEDGLEDYSFALPHLLNEVDMEFYLAELKEIKDEFLGLKLTNLEIKSSPKIFLVPGLGFTKSLQRLGRGKGFYDRYLAKSDGYIKIGVCSEAQLLEELPTDDFDIDMDFLITEKEIYRRG